MEFDWWNTIQARERLSNIHCSAVIGNVLIGRRTFSWQVQIQVVWRKRGVEKNTFQLKNNTNDSNLSNHDKSRP